ncbi:peptidylprolyl isomerase [Albirhodobacter sp. R86504]|uniref:peptidylprolyl isomerase n=1 Tax=Albirhodobacter sp. R86504 TaxID=3093848 RepID=UPI00366A9303
MRASLFVLGVTTALTTILTPALMATTGAIMLHARPAAAQSNPFAPVISVNGLGITRFEIDQRAKMVSLLGRSPDPVAEAESDLIDDRLRMSAAKSAGIEVSREAVTQGMAEFAGRANMTAEQFLAAIGAEGVEPQTFRDFVEAGIAWREVIRAKYAGKVNISETEAAFASAPEAERGKGTRLLMQEFIIPTPPGREAEAAAIAERVSAADSEASFGALAREYSATASRDAGGRLPWKAINDVPPSLRAVMLGLTPGSNTEPLNIPNAIAVFRLRGIDEEGPQEADEQILDYAEYLIPSIDTEAGQIALARVQANAQTCDDLYAFNKGQDAALLTRETRSLPEIPTDVALQLAQMDSNEISTAIRRGGNSVVVMLCARTRPEAEGAPSSEALRDRIANARVGQFAEGDLADLRANAVIIR